MTTKHNFSFADELYQGKGNFPPMFSSNERAGAPCNLPTKVYLGAPAAALATGLIKAATTTELPSTSTVTYTTDDAGSSPFDDAAVPTAETITTSTGATASVWPLDVPRNIAGTVTHNSSVVAMTVTVTGYDEWLQKVVETISVAATGTSQAVTGLKAFKYVESIALTSGSNAQANTANIGWGDVLGLPYKLDSVTDIISWWEDDAFVVPTTSLFTAAVETTATATTGDVRGTVNPTDACDGTKVFSLWMYVADKSSINGLKGVDQYAG